MFHSAHCVEKIVLASNVIQGIVLGAQNSRDFVFLQRKDSARSQPNREYRTTNCWRRDSFKAATVYKKLSFEDRMLVTKDGATPSCNSAERTAA